ncbi:T-cell activation Rho GTPase-activating protein-like [Aquila chrysaetos chrysaetos]|uniref:T-cell activation Rho GTPase-activating protein-like n=1 Tax=Aquila chrysaetos chrysaetos TaxID=223781 RepID=UPI0011771396|nr:T-cell activation Rho GTPase-activating protein-like [Aquila chrysaetos chrysaetos]
MGQANCCCSSREALTNVKPVLSTNMQLSRGHKRSERCLLLLQEELVLAKLQCGTTVCPQLHLALDPLWVLSGRKESAGEEKEEEEEEGSDKDRTSLMFVWPTGSCIANFGSWALKELWMGTLLGAQDTRRSQESPVEVIQRQEPGGADGGPGKAGGSSSTRKRRGLPWPFALRRTLAAAQVPGQASSGCSRTLFGQSLAALCREAGTLPHPIQELLAVLQQEGPLTEGIFHRAASRTAFWELWEALDREADIDLGSQPVLLLLAIILKVSASDLQLEELRAGLECSKAQMEPLALQDFLQSIPSKLLVNNLYKDWVAAMQKTSREEKFEELKAQVWAAACLLIRSADHCLRAPGKLCNTAAGSRLPRASLGMAVGQHLVY